MALLFAPQGKFQLGEVDDAGECYEAIVEHIHCAACGVPETEGGREQSCGYPPCPACAQFKVPTANLSFLSALQHKLIFFFINFIFLFSLA